MTTHSELKARYNAEVTQLKFDLREKNNQIHHYGQKAQVSIYSVTLHAVLLHVHMHMHVCMVVACLLISIHACMHSYSNIYVYRLCLGS